MNYNKPPFLKSAPRVALVDRVVRLCAKPPPWKDITEDERALLEGPIPTDVVMTVPDRARVYWKESVTRLKHHLTPFKAATEMPIFMDYETVVHLICDASHVKAAGMTTTELATNMQYGARGMAITVLMMTLSSDTINFVPESDDIAEDIYMLAVAVLLADMQTEWRKEKINARQRKHELDALNKNEFYMKYKYAIAALVKHALKEKRCKPSKQRNDAEATQPTQLSAATELPSGDPEPYSVAFVARKEAKLLAHASGTLSDLLRTELLELLRGYAPEKTDPYHHETIAEHTKPAMEAAGRWDQVRKITQIGIDDDLQEWLTTGKEPTDGNEADDSSREEEPDASLPGDLPPIHVMPKRRRFPAGACKRPTGLPQ